MPAFLLTGVLVATLSPANAGDGQAASELDAPIRLTAFPNPLTVGADKAAGKRPAPIDIGALSPFGHAAPWIADVDGDDDQDLVVGDFPGYFWWFANVGSDEAPEYVAKGKLQAGGEDAKTPVY